MQNLPIGLIFSGFIGILLQEIMQWYDLRGKLLDKDVADLFFSRQYLIIFSLLSIVSIAAIAVYIGDDYQKYSNRDVLVLGLAFPTILRKMIGASRRTGGKVTLGNSVGKYLS